MEDEWEKLKFWIGDLFLWRFRKVLFLFMVVKEIGIGRFRRCIFGRFWWFGGV